jgi:hypothetical protein
VEYFEMFVQYARLNPPATVRREVRAKFLRSRRGLFRRES